MTRRAPTNFVLLTTQRTGSSWLITLLDSDPSIAAHGELFLRSGEPYPPWGARNVKRFSHFSDRLRRKERGFPRLRTFAYLDHLYQSDCDAQSIGFKLTYDQLVRHPEILFYCVKRGVRVVHLVRRNLLDIVISRELMKQRGVAHATSEHDRRLLRANLNVRTLYVRLWNLDLQMSFCRTSLRTLRVANMEIAYEELLSERSALGSVLEFLGLAADGADRLTSPLMRLSDKTQSELVENYAAVSRALNGTRFAQFLTG
jgi:LPS sulfotransferase NodH